MLARLALHVAAVAMVQATSTTIAALLPVLARKRFGAGEWETLFITAAPTVFFTFSIFWNDLFSHTRFLRYILVFWTMACLPLALVAFATDYWMLLVPHLLCSLGGAGYHPAAGEVLKRLYPDGLRGRIYGVVWGFTLVAGAVLGYGLGEWLSHDEEAFRIFLPAAAAIQLGGVLILAFLAARTGVDVGRVRVAEDRSFYDRVVEPVTHMREVLKADPAFARYEAAYMTYGIGWMICYALLPIFVTDRLRLDYDQIAGSTQVAYLVGMVLMIGPAGYLMDRLGAARSTGLSFLMLIVYPLGLMGSTDAASLAVVSFVYGLSHAGTSVGWMLGPVALAPSPDKVPQYVAIHATFVGIRGKIFQGLGVLLYSLTHGFTLPFLLAAAAFAWSAVQMWRLDRFMRPGARVKTPA